MNVAVTTVTETLSEPRVSIMEQVTANLVPIIRPLAPRPRIRMEPPLLVPIPRTAGAEDIQSVLSLENLVIPPEPTDSRTVQVPTKQASPMPPHSKAQPAKQRPRRVVSRQSDAIGRVPSDPKQHKRSHRVTCQKKAAEISAKFHIMSRARPESSMTMARNEMGGMSVDEFYPQDPAPNVPTNPVEIHQNNKTYFSL